MRQNLPQVMALVFDERIQQSAWIDYIHRARTLAGLIRQLSKEIKDGQIVGYRLMRTELEITGICPQAEQDYLKRQSNQHSDQNATNPGQ